MSAYRHDGTDADGLSIYRETPGPVIVHGATGPALPGEPSPPWVDAFGRDTRRADSLDGFQLDGVTTIAPGGDILCSCGNRPDLDGFYPANVDGSWASTDPADPAGPIPDGFTFGLYRCATCDTVHDYEKLTERSTDDV